MRVTYPGPSEAVDLDSIGVLAPRGEPVDVPDELGLELVFAQGWGNPDGIAEPAAAPEAAAAPLEAQPAPANPADSAQPAQGLTGEVA